MATLFTQGFVVLVQLFYVNKTMNFSISRYPAKSIIFGGLLIVLSIVGLRYMGHSYFQYVAGVIVIGLILLAYLILFVRRELAAERIDLSGE